MKRISAALALTAALSLGVTAYAQTETPAAPAAAPAAPIQFSDIPAGHYAQEAVDKIVQAGLILGFPDGTFRGNENLTRYQAALIFSRLLDLIAQGRIGTEAAPVEGGQNLDADTLEAVQNAVQELAADLAQLGVRVADLEDSRVSADDLARVEALAQEARDLAEAVAAAQDAMAAGTADASADASADVTVEGGQDAQALQDLSDQIEAASIAADTALSQARDLQDRFDELAGRIEELEAQIAGLADVQAGLSETTTTAETALSAAQELQDRVDELTTIQQELRDLIEAAAADQQAAAADAQANIANLTSTTEGQADAIAALNDLVVLLNQDVLTLQDQVGDITSVNEAQQAILDEIPNIYATNEDLEALREFTTLLRRDQVALTERVDSLEARVTTTETNITNLQGRVATLERNAFTVSGGLAISYYVGRTWYDNGSGSAPDFDIDRVIAGTRFSTGENADNADDNVTWYGDINGSRTDAAGLANGNIVDNNNQSTTQTTVNKVGTFTITPSLTFTFNSRNATPSNAGSVESNTTPITFTVGLATADAAGDPTDATSVTNLLQFQPTFGDVFTIGAAPLTVTFGNIRFRFADYAFNANDTALGTGILVSYTGLTFVPFSPTIQAVYGSLNNGQYYLGGNLVFTIAPNFTLGGYYGQRSGDVFSGWNTPSLTVYGANFNATSLLGFLNLKGEWSVADPYGPGAVDDPAQVATYLQAGVTFGAFTVNGNYRRIDAAYDTLGLSGNSSSIEVTDDRPYNPNQMGFGAGVSVKLGFLGGLTINGNFDQMSELSGTGPSYLNLSGATTNVVSKTEFGVNTTLRLIGFDITPSFASRSETDGGLINYNQTAFGVSVRHAGTAADSLIPGLNVGVSYTNTAYSGDIFTASFNKTVLTADATYALRLAPFTITPSVYFAQTTYTPEAAGFAAGVTGTANINVPNASDDVTQFRHGVAVTTDPILFGASIALSYVMDTANHTNSLTNGGSWTASTFQANAGLTFNSLFGLANSSFGVKYGFRQDVNRTGKAGFGGDTFGAGSDISGLYFDGSYYGFQFAYGIFAVNPYDLPAGTGTIWGQAIKIGYAFKF